MRLFNGIVARIVASQTSYPPVVRRMIRAVATGASGPARALKRLTALGQPVPPPVEAGEGTTRLLVAPMNYAGQGNQWCRAVERAFPEVTARSMEVRAGNDFRFATDYVVPAVVYAGSRRWQRDHDTALRAFTHVLAESFVPLTGGTRTVLQELAALTADGVTAGILCHGSDIRSPQRHRRTHTWSAFGDDARSTALQEVADRNSRLLAEFTGPVFVSTPDLLVEVPNGLWLPVVVDLARWTSETDLIMSRTVPRVAHIPSSAGVKGTAEIEPTMRRLEAEGLLEYVQITGVPSDEMPAHYADADIVLDQFVMGSYGVAACEAMAAGRVTVGNVDFAVREYVERRTGLNVPIVQAYPDTLEETLRELCADPQAARALAARGPAFVRAVHDGTRSAQVLAEFLGL